jgi:oligopeptide transport system ATP-binding protein
MSLLSVRDLRVSIATRQGIVTAVDGIDLAVDRGEILGIVGESGSGKTQLLLALMGLLPETATSTGAVNFSGRGPAMVFQDPLTALNPYLPVGLQVAEALGKTLADAETRRRVVAMLQRLRIADAEARLAQYPHQLSGGMRQRILIAMALIASPDLILADEPTTALDVTVQADILDLLRAERRDHGRSLILVTHDLGIVAGLCDRVMVLYAGRVVEEAPVEALFAVPRHPYTRALMAALPRLDDAIDAELVAIPGTPPDPARLGPGCAFAPRCAERIDRCAVETPALRDIGPGRRAACHRLDDAGSP